MLATGTQECALNHNFAAAVCYCLEYGKYFICLQGGYCEYVWLAMANPD